MLHELSNIHNLQLLCLTDAVECQFDVKLARCLGVCVTIFLFSIIRHPRLLPIFTISPKVADNRGKTVYTYISGAKKSLVREK